MNTMISQTKQSYQGLSYYNLKDVVENNSDSFETLIDVYEQTLHSRKTPYGKSLKGKTENLLLNIVAECLNNPITLLIRFSQLQDKKSNFLIKLRNNIAIELRKSDFDKIIIFLNACLSDMSKVIESLSFIKLNQEEPNFSNQADLSLKPFRFPSTELTGEGFDEIEIIDRQQKGLLLAVGYKTGMYGLLEDQRREVLDNLYTKEIPKNTKIENIVKWGKPNTGQRLREIAYSLAHFTKQEKANPRGDYSVSISERESDLMYLKETYYDGVYDFKYPRT